MAVRSPQKDLSYPLRNLVVSADLYAIFKHVGSAGTVAKTYGNIFGTCFPQSSYQLSNRPHLAVMPANYNPHAEDAEEEIWIPIELKKA